MQILFLKENAFHYPSSLKHELVIVCSKSGSFGVEICLQYFSQYCVVFILRVLVHVITYTVFSFISPLEHAIKEVSLNTYMFASHFGEKSILWLLQ